MHDEKDEPKVKVSNPHLVGLVKCKDKSTGVAWDGNNYECWLQFV